MSGKHTPGPWTLREQPDWPFDIMIDAPDEAIVLMHRHAYGTGDKCIADVMAGRAFPHEDRPKVIDLNARQIANARLIAAAPDLLEALEEVTRDMREAAERLRELGDDQAAGILTAQAIKANRITVRARGEA